MGTRATETLLGPKVTGEKIVNSTPIGQTVDEEDAERSAVTINDRRQRELMTFSPSDRLLIAQHPRPSLRKSGKYQYLDGLWKNKLSVADSIQEYVIWICNRGSKAERFEATTIDSGLSLRPASGMVAPKDSFPMVVSVAASLQPIDYFSTISFLDREKVTRSLRLSLFLLEFVPQFSSHSASSSSFSFLAKSWLRQATVVKISLVNLTGILTSPNRITMEYGYSHEVNVIVESIPSERKTPGVKFEWLEGKTTRVLYHKYVVAPGRTVVTEDLEK